MARARFDPTKAQGGLLPTDSPSTDRPLTVSEVGDLIRATLENGIPNAVRVVGEVSNLSARNHWYFSLKDEDAVIQCVVWATTAARLGPPPADGEQIVVRGTIGHYAPQGRTQLYVNALERVGAGALEQRFRALCEELRRLGYFDDARKRPIPAFPRRVAVITSRASAAVRDVVATSAARCKAVELLIVNVRVQGDGAANDVATAIEWVDRNKDRLGVDVVVVTRGGGSIEDLWAFNERMVADAVYRCSLPVIAAIGHESDVTIIELVADVRAATPTQAAMRAVPDAQELLRQTAFLSNRLSALMHRRLDVERRRLDGLARSELIRRPDALVRRARERLEALASAFRRTMYVRLATEAARLERLAVRLRPEVAGAVQQSRLDALGARLRRGMNVRLVRADQSLRLLERHLGALGPDSVLARGFSYTQRADGALVRSINDVRSGEPIQTRVADGVIRSVVGGTDTRRRVRRGDSSEQMDLFGSGG